MINLRTMIAVSGKPTSTCSPTRGWMSPSSRRRRATSTTWSASTSSTRTPVLKWRNQRRNKSVRKKWIRKSLMTPKHLFVKHCSSFCALLSKKLVCLNNQLWEKCNENESTADTTTATARIFLKDIRKQHAKNIFKTIQHRCIKKHELNELFNDKNISFAKQNVSEEATSQSGNIFVKGVDTKKLYQENIKRLTTELAIFCSLEVLRLLVVLDS